MRAAEPVRAAGVVLLDSGRVLLVHRPRHDDWSLPKGKLDRGEVPLAAAVREAFEETGYRVVLGPPLADIAYLSQGRPKLVHYWSARPASAPGFAANDEVDEIAWIPVASAPETLSYPDDVLCVMRAAELPATSPLVILRHGHAVKRADFAGKDAARPLSDRGKAQSRALEPLLGAYGIEVAHSSNAERCHRTLRHFAKSRASQVFLQPAFSEEGCLENPGKAAKRMRRVVRDPRPIVVCSHRPVLPILMEATAAELGADPASPEWDPKLPPGGFVVVHRAFDAEGKGRVIAVERHSVDEE